jgi:FdhD protein
MKPSKSYNILRINKDSVKDEEDLIILEYPFTIFIDDEEIITLLCSPKSLEYLAIGFLYSEGFIESYSAIKNIQIDEDKGSAYINLNIRKTFNEKLQGKRTITSGCGKGTVFYNVLDSFKSKKITNTMDIKPNEIVDLMRSFNKDSELFNSTGGVHACAICNEHGIIYFEEDIGRHNALDKVLGKALVENMDLSDKIILTSGRISSEMLIKAAKRGIPVVVSRSAPTSLAVDMARELNITLVGFVRGEKMNIYSSFPSLKF